MKKRTKNLVMCLIPANFFLWNNLALSEDAEQKRKAEFEANRAKMNSKPRANTTHPYQTVARISTPVEQSKTPIELPGVPQVPGNTQYINGQRQDMEKETVYSASYNISMPVKEAADWYENGLSMYNWKIIQKTSGGMIGKNSNGDYVTVSINVASGLPKYKSTIVITVRQVKSKR